MCRVCRWSSRRCFELSCGAKDKFIPSSLWYTVSLQLPTFALAVVWSFQLSPAHRNLILSLYSSTDLCLFRSVLLILLERERDTVLDKSWGVKFTGIEPTLNLFLLTRSHLKACYCNKKNKIVRVVVFGPTGWRTNTNDLALSNKGIYSALLSYT